MACRCGHPTDSTEPHPCHAKGYGCKNPATFRLYNPTFPALAGMQPKLQMTGTWACDECWAEFSRVLKKST